MKPGLNFISEPTSIAPAKRIQRHPLRAPLVASAEVSERRSELIPVKEWPNRHAWPPIGGLRHLIFNAGKNNFDQVIRRIGRRVLIDEAAFFAWAKQQGGVK